MLPFRLTITVNQRKELDRKLITARQRGDFRLCQFILAILAVAKLREYEQAAVVLLTCGVK